jgi:hypothetical protein
MDRHDGLGVPCDRGFDQICVEIARIGLDFDEDGTSPRFQDCGCRRDEGHGGSNDLVAGSNTQREQRQIQAGTRIYHQHMPAAQIFCQFALEAADIFSRGEDIGF